MQKTYTLAQRTRTEDSFQPVPGIPRNMTLEQARRGAEIARSNGFDVVAFNTGAE